MKKGEIYLDLIVKCDDYIRDLQSSSGEKIIFIPDNDIINSIDDLLGSDLIIMGGTRCLEELRDEITVVLFSPVWRCMIFLFKIKKNEIEYFSLLAMERFKYYYKKVYIDNHELIQMHRDMSLIKYGLRLIV